MSAKKKIALIGGAGFIGHHLAIELAREGHEPHVIDGMHVNSLLSFVSADCALPGRKLYSSFVNERIELLEKNRIPLHVQDAREYHLLNKLLLGIKPDVVVLLAAVAHADRSNKDPFNTFDHSLRTLENALDYSRGNVEHFVYFSSSMVYGNFPNGFVTEETPCNPLGIYGALKFAGEKIVIAYNQVFNLPYTIIRPSALYGERCVSRRVGQVFIENAILGKEIQISGDGSERLDFTYVGDVVQGVRRIIESPRSRGEVFNITYGESRSVTDMTDILQRHFPEVQIKYIPKDKLMPSRGSLCVDKGRELVGYEPSYPLEVGYQKYIEWYKERLGGILR